MKNFTIVVLSASLSIILFASCREDTCPPVGFEYYRNKFHQDSANVVTYEDSINIFFEQDKLRDTNNKAVVNYFEIDNDTIIKFYFIGKTSAGSKYYRPEKYIRTMADTVEIGINHQAGLLKNALNKSSCTLPNSFYSVDTLLIYKPKKVIVNFLER